jgi:hypothetical protein
MRPLLFMLVAASLVLVACGGGDNDDETTPDAEQPFMDTSAPQLSDTDYVAGLCDGVEGYMAAVLSKGEPEIRAARDQFEVDVRAMHPPEGTQDFHREFVEYLSGAQSDPTLLITTDPPLPTGELRERLATAEGSASCQYQLFTRSDAAPTATPGG